MIVETREIGLSTPAGYSCHDLTEIVTGFIEEVGLDQGTVTVFCSGSTGALTTVEYEPGLVVDLETLFERIAPQDATYRHNERWHDGNGHSHVRASLVGPSITVPIVGGRPALGTWQQIVFLDLDRPARDRRLVVTMMGTAG
jgi:secondary thiamine-phosphate synthase enzyme